MTKPAFLRRLQTFFSPAPRLHRDGGTLEELQSAIGYIFRDPELLIRALRHRSYAMNDKEQSPDESSNERLEFLGDAVLSLVVNDYLYRTFPSKREGALTKMKSVIVSKPILSHYAKRNRVGSFVLLSENAQRSRVGEAESVLADTLEAIFGAVFLDGGFEAAGACIKRLLLADIEDVFDNEDNVNYKSLLQEYIQALHKVPPRYVVRSTSGPQHDKEFAVEVLVHGKGLASGAGKTKKHAEQEAAKEAYKKLLNTDAIEKEHP
jgi:ribonuclease-3